MKQNYDFAIKEVLKSEGGYSNDPADSGGETNFGITQRETSIPVRTMTVEQAKAIYKTKYWNALNCDSLESGVDFTVFDYGVNSGIGRAKKVLDKFKDKEGNALIDAINDERAAFLQRLATTRPKDQKFLKGWLSRVSRVRSQSHYLAAGKQDTTTGPVTGASASLGMWASLSQYFHNHPYTIAFIAAGVGLSVWALVHYMRNKNA